ncbi:MAG: hypothetical protein EBS07_12540, partial [Sphingobacteriia bacterium]|nr:hypothetical protein [Sphingobacteriia bacterium]
CEISLSTTFRVKNYNSGGADALVKIGDEFAGGIVVGMFNPNGVTCFGNTAFGRLPTWYDEVTASESDKKKLFEFLTNGSEKECGTYNSVYEPWGYGFTLPANHNQQNDSWLLIVSPYNVRLDMMAADIDSSTDNYIFSGLGSAPYFKTGIHTVPGGFCGGSSFLTENSSTSNNLETEPIQSISTFTIPGWYVNNDSTNFQIIAYKRQTQTFTWSHGGTSFCYTLDDNLNGIFQTPSNESSDCTEIRAYVDHDGSYGTLSVLKNGVLGTTYWGNDTTFDGCSQVSDICNPSCAISPEIRIKSLGKQFAMARSTGWWSRNWGIYNSCKLFSSDIAEYFLRSTYTHIGSLVGLRNKFGMTGAPNAGWNSSFNSLFFRSSNQASASGTAKKTTIGEALSSMNRYYNTTEEMIDQDGMFQVPTN